MATVLLAELEIFHSRPIAPTRRVALGLQLLPVDPAPGFGGLLLAGIVAAHIDSLDPDLHGELGRLLTDLEHGARIPQPRLRHRLQVDRIGLARSRHRLVGEGDLVDWDLEHGGRPESQILGAAYAAGHLPRPARRQVMDALRVAMRWQGPIGPALAASLAGRRGAGDWSPAMVADPTAWALGILGFEGAGLPTRTDVQRRFRDLLRAAHPDLGGDQGDAARRIRDLTEARRLLLR